MLGAVSAEPDGNTINAEVVAHLRGSNAFHEDEGTVGRELAGKKVMMMKEVDCTNLKPAANLNGCDLSKTDLQGVNLVKATLIAADLRSAKLTGGKLTGADLSGTKFGGADLGGTFLLRANLTDAVLIGTNLLKADLRNADLRRAKLGFANLTDANLSNADLSNASMLRTDFTRADLTNANLTNSGLRTANLTNLVSVTWSNTICPDGSNSDDNRGSSCVCLVLDIIYGSYGPDPSLYLTGELKQYYLDNCKVISP